MMSIHMYISTLWSYIFVFNIVFKFMNVKKCFDIKIQANFVISYSDKLYLE